MQVVSWVTVDLGAFPGTTEWGGIIMNNIIWGELHDVF